MSVVLIALVQLALNSINFGRIISNPHYRWRNRFGRRKCVPITRVVITVIKNEGASFETSSTLNPRCAGEDLGQQWAVLHVWLRSKRLCNLNGLLFRNETELWNKGIELQPAELTFLARTEIKKLCTTPPSSFRLVLDFIDPITSILNAQLFHNVIQLFRTQSIQNVCVNCKYGPNLFE